MNSPAAFLAMISMTVPAASLSQGVLFGGRTTQGLADGEVQAFLPSAGSDPHPSGEFGPQVPEPYRPMAEAHRPPVSQQVRITQRMIIRISPTRPEAVETMLDELPRRPIREQFAEQPVNGCIQVEAIAGVQPMPRNRLLLFMRDHGVLSASLDRACNAADFYSGFYVERPEDGALCPRRDQLRSRTGARCEITTLHRLVATRD